MFDKRQVLYRSGELQGTTVHVGYVNEDMKKLNHSKSSQNNTIEFQTSVIFLLMAPNHKWIFNLIYHIFLVECILKKVDLIPCLNEI